MSFLNGSHVDQKLVHGGGEGPPQCFTPLRPRSVFKEPIVLRLCPPDRLVWSSV